MLSTVTSFEKLPKHNEYGFISESFALNWYWYFHLSESVDEILSPPKIITFNRIHHLLKNMNVHKVT